MGLHNEIDSLKQKNKAYEKANTQLMNLVETVNRKCDAILEELSESHTQMNTYTAHTESELNNIHKNNAELSKQIIDLASCVNALEKQLDSIHINFKKINYQNKELKEISNQLSSLSEYVNCFWSATKALWVNNFISELDDTINSEREEKPHNTVENNEKHNIDEYDTSYATSFDTDFYWTHYSSDVY